MQHIDDEHLEEYFLNQLNEAESQEVEEHVRRCQLCGARYEEARIFINAMREALVRDRHNRG
jgi:hypothetical protein